MRRATGPLHRRRSVGGLLVALSVLAGAGCADGASDGAEEQPAQQQAEEEFVADVSPLSPIQPGTNVWTAPDGTEITFEVVVPDGRELGTVGPVLIAFPPGGQDLELTRRIVDSDWREQALARNVVVVSPAAPSTGLWYTDDSAALVTSFLDAIATGFPPTDGRFDLAGISNGGLSAFRAALDHPDRFRSMVLAPGAPPAGATDQQFVALADLRIAQFVGGEDASWLARSQESHDRFTTLGIDTVLEVVPGDDHFLDSLDPAQMWDALGL